MVKIGDKSDWILIIRWIFCAVLSFAGSVILLNVLVLAGVRFSIDTPIGQMIQAIILYGCTLIFLTLMSKPKKIQAKDFGLKHSMQWRDIGLSVVGFFAYILCTIIATRIAMLLPWFDAMQDQEVGLSNIYGLDRAIAFLSLVVVAPFMEEILFRGFLYGKMRNSKMSWWIPAIVVSILFGAAHMQWNVAVDVFCLSMVACKLREKTDSIWSGILLHMIKNGIAFMVLLQTMI